MSAMELLIYLVVAITCSGVATDSVVHMSQSNFNEMNDGEPRLEYYQKAKKGFSFASYYGDHMVLQKGPKRAVIWGYCSEIGERIIVHFDNRGVFSAVVKLNTFYGVGIWKLKLPAESSRGPFKITAISSLGSITLNDVLFGDVWICSGQSNMQFATIQVFNATNEVQDANNYPDIRLFTVDDVASDFELIDLPKILQPWSIASNASVGGPQWKYFSAVCWLYGKYLYKTLGYPLGLVATSWGGTPIEAWTSPEALESCGLSKQTESVVHSMNSDEEIMMASSSLWNSMIHPLLNMTIYGAIWYQGEANTGGHFTNEYNCTFPAMIRDWRKKFNLGSLSETNSSFPFGFVQLAPVGADETVGNGYPDIRWHQTADYGYVPNKVMPNVFMAVALDLPDFTSPFGPVHPRDKQDVVYRLTLSGLAVAYKQQVKQFQGPLPSSFIFYFPNDNITLNYDGFDIDVHNIEGFELCCSISGSKSCSEGKAWWLTTSIIYSNSTSISLFMGVCNYGQKILGIRYLWRETPCPFKRCAVYSKELPAPPFVWYRYASGHTSTGAQDDAQGTVLYHNDWSDPVELL